MCCLLRVPTHAGVTRQVIVELLCVYAVGGDLVVRCTAILPAQSTIDSVTRRSAGAASPLVAAAVSAAAPAGAPLLSRRPDNVVLVR